MTAKAFWFVLGCVLSFPFAAAGQGVNPSAIDPILGRADQKTADVYKLAFPRTDLHVTVRGLAIKPGLALTAPPAWVITVPDRVGRNGAFEGGVLSFAVPRSGEITANGSTIAPAAGVAEAINFQAADSGQVATTGDFVLTAAEVNPVLSELRTHQIAVIALHSHMLTEQPRLFFLHFWAVGDPQSVGAGIKAGLGRVSVK